jgi:hypothetical protein
MIIVRIQSTAGKGAETQSTIEGQQREVKRKGTQGVLLHSRPEEEEEDFVQETPEAALIAAQAYLLTTRPEPRDPREDMHQAAI